MISLNSLVAPSRRPLIMTICGEGGIGKTTLASLFPNLVLVRAEDGSKSIESRGDVAMFPVAKSTDEVMEAANALLVEDHPFKTVAFDTVTKFNTFAEAEVIEADCKAGGKATAINTALGGYGAGYSAVANYHFELRKLAQRLADERGMNVLFLAHVEVESLDLPDQPQFSRYTIRMHKKSVANYVDDVDVVAFLKLKTFVTGSDKDGKRANTSGERIITCYPHPAHVSKNRLGIKVDLPFVEGVNPFAEYLV